MQRCDTPLRLLWRFTLKCIRASLHSYRMNETNNKCCFESNARFFSATGWLLPLVAKLRAVPTPLRGVLCQEQGIYSIRKIFFFPVSFDICVVSLSLWGMRLQAFYCDTSQQNANSVIIYSYCIKEKWISFKEHKNETFWWMFMLLFSIQWKRWWPGTAKL